MADQNETDQKPHTHEQTGYGDHELAAWCVVGPNEEILFLSKAQHRAQIFAEGTANMVEPLFRKRASRLGQAGQR